MPQSFNAVEDAEMDFAAMLEESFKKGFPEQGDIVNGTILSIDQHGLLVDIGFKKDGIVTKQDLERLGNGTDFQIGQEVPVMISRLEDSNGNLLVSVSQAVQAGDWEKAEQLMNSGDVWEGRVVEANRGGLIVTFGNLRGFVPASHVMNVPRGVSEQERHDHMAELVAKKIRVKVIEVNRKRRRLVFSQREAMREQRTMIKEQLMGDLKEGDVREGVVSGLRDFGAFVDLGGADGLIHISELAWHRVQHPREVVAVGDRVRVYVIHLDENDKRIGLSLKRLQDNPWAKIDETYHIGQLVLGEVSRVAPYGAFIRLEEGVEALLHSTQISDGSIENVEHLIAGGQYLLLRVISIETDRQRLGLSWKEVTDSERQNWAAENGYEVRLITIDPLLLKYTGEPVENPVESSE